MSPAPRARRAFSLFEVVAVVLLLAVAAGMIVPRLTRRDAREAQREAESVRDLLSAAALRASLTSQPLSLQFTPPRLAPQTPLPEDEEESAWTARLVWRDDPLIPPVELARLELTRALAAGVPQPESWRLDLSGVDGVPALALTLRDPSGRQWLVTLEAGATAATLHDADAPAPAAAAAIDLDASGMRDAAW